MTGAISWDSSAWDDHLYWLYWQGRDKKTLKKINSLVAAIRRTPFEGIGKPEALKGDLSGYWSRRIDKTHRLVYSVGDNGEITVLSCRQPLLVKAYQPYLEVPQDQ